jgi:ubiquinone/menaquinone biosynthesis C-methylase UbiE
VVREIPERYRWAVGLLNVRPNDHVLEIGCGRGQMIGLICERLVSGRVTAIDRSGKMVDAARRSSELHIASGKAEVLHQELLDARLPSASFDKIFLFNINAFWMDPVAELAEVRRLLKPGGSFQLFHQPPPDHEIEEFVDRFKLNLEKNGFQVDSVSVESIAGTELACVVSSPSPR